MGPETIHFNSLHYTVLGTALQLKQNTTQHNTTKLTLLYKIDWSFSDINVAPYQAASQFDYNKYHQLETNYRNAVNPLS